MGYAVNCVFVLLTFLHTRVAANEVCKAYNLHEVLVVLAKQGAKMQEMSSTIEQLVKSVEALNKKIVVLARQGAKVQEISSNMEHLVKAVEALVVNKSNDAYKATRELAWTVLRNRCGREQLEKKHEPQGSPSTTSCEDGWTMYGASCYLFPDVGRRFSKAQDYCAKLNASLVHVEDEAENQYIKCHLLSSPDHYWIGMKHDATDGKWKWVDTNDVVEYKNWGLGQPDNTDDEEDCATFWLGYAYSWNDDSCDRSSIKPICEKKAEAR